MNPFFFIQNNEKNNTNFKKKHFSNIPYPVVCRCFIRIHNRVGNNK